MGEIIEIVAVSQCEIGLHYDKSAVGAQHAVDFPEGGGQRVERIASTWNIWQNVSAVNTIVCQCA